MSSLFDENDASHPSHEHPCNAVDLVIEPRSHDLGGFTVNRMIPYAKHRMVGPWVFFDHMGPTEFKPGDGLNVRPHPHINLATVTYLFEGEIIHRDSLGNVQTITSGAVNLMVAGKGIVHSERTSPELRATGQKMDGLQLWLALPEADEETDPVFYHYGKDEIPEVTSDGIDIRVIIGTAYGITSPVKTFAETLYVEIRLKAGQSIELPKSEELAAYIVDGLAEVNNAEIPKQHMAVFSNHAKVKLAAKEDTLLVIIGGETLTERHIYWNFVSSRKERIEQAKQDWKQGKFPVIDGDSEEFIPLPE